MKKERDRMNVSMTVSVRSRLMNIKINEKNLNGKRYNNISEVMEEALDHLKTERGWKW